MHYETENITVEQAIAKGRKTILLPCLLMLFGPAMAIYLITRHAYAMMLAPMILLLGAALAAIYRAYAVPRWKIWAFSKVRNVHELKRRAEFAWLMPNEENAGIRKFERWTGEQKQAWLGIEKKFDAQDIFVERPEVPAETRVYFAWYKKLWVMLLALITLGFGALPYFFLDHDRSLASLVWQCVVGIFFVSLGGWLFYESLKQLINRKAQLVMNSYGLETAGSGFCSWSQIRDLRIFPSGNGRYRTFHLRYWADNVYIDFELDGMTIGRRKLDRYLRTYQGRHSIAYKNPKQL